MARARPVLATGNFDRNLAGIQEFLSLAGAPEAFDRLVHRLESTVIPQLQRFPESGADFLSRAPLSFEARTLFEEVVRLAGPDSEVRQLIDGDYIVLYLVEGGAIYLLSIKHHRQLSFDLLPHWP